mgnify:CR=1 FL=1
MSKEKVKKEELVEEAIPFLTELTEERKRGLCSLDSVISALSNKVHDISKFSEEESELFIEKTDEKSSESFSQEYERNNDNLFHQVDKLNVILEKMNRLI